MSKDDWMTPKWLIERVRSFLGEIDLDPASSELANTQVKAAKFYSEEESGLENPWFGRIFLNPPYSQPLSNQFTEAFLELEFTAGILLCNFDSSTARCQALLGNCSFCLLAKRIAFVDPETMQPVKGNRFGQALFYRGNRGAEFWTSFYDLGFSNGILRKET